MHGSRALPSDDFYDSPRACEEKHNTNNNNKNNKLFCVLLVLLFGYILIAGLVYFVYFRKPVSKQVISRIAC